MKNISILILLFTAAACSSKNNTPAANNANAVTISMKGIADLKIGMKKESVEKLLKQKIALPRFSSENNDVYSDTASCKYKGVDCKLIFIKETEGDSSYTVKLSEIESSSPLLKTPSGIGIGDDKIKIINAYDGYRMTIAPNIDYLKHPPLKSKTKATILLFDDESDKVIVFNMNSNTVESMGVMLYEEGD